ncbi:MAG: broad specificity phosphatase PhoE [Paraglaciecola psychrophila]|jgi:broad specificity phosphatase PhoE
MSTQYTGRLGLVRHGQTSANIDQVWHGYTDTPLTALGQAQAQKLGSHFHHYMQPDVIYASPLQRAKITAQAIASNHNIEVNLDPRLMEFNLGDWEGRSFQELRDDGNIIEQLVSNPDFTPPNGESQNQVKERFVAAIEDIVSRHPQQNVVLVAHGAAIGIALSHYLHGDSRRWPKYSKANTAFTEFCLNSSSLISYNNTAHLD